jgi:hypothetical protein
MSNKTWNHQKVYSLTKYPRILTRNVLEVFLVYITAAICAMDFLFSCVPWNLSQW